MVLLQTKEIGDYSEVFKATLYNKHSGEYCEYLELLQAV